MDLQSVEIQPAMEVGLPQERANARGGFARQVAAGLLLVAAGVATAVVFETFGREAAGVANRAAVAVYDSE